MNNNKNFIIKIFFFFKSNFLSFSFFSLYGLIANIFSFILFFLLTRSNIFDYKISYIITSLIINTINYFVYLKIFKSLKSLASVMKFIFVQFFIGISHLILIIIFVEIFDMDKYLSHIISNIFLAIILYLLYKYFVYSGNDKKV